MFRLSSLFLLATIAVSAQSAAALTFNFFQGGYAEGAFVSGSFSGEDLNQDGQLTGFAEPVRGGGPSQEITGFSMSFSGNSLVAPFTLDFFELFGLVYDLDGGGGLGDGETGAIEGIGAMGADFGYLVGPGPFALCDGVDACSVVDDFLAPGTDFSVELVQITAIPLPAALPLFFAALAGLGFVRRKAKS